MRTFLRKNLMIAVSIALPLLVVLFFALASVLPGLFSAPPVPELVCIGMSAIAIRINKRYISTSNPNIAE